MSRYRDSLREVDRLIKYDRISLVAQQKYFEYLLNGGATRELESVERKITELRARKEKILSDQDKAPQRISELKIRLGTLDVKKRKLLVDPKIQRVKELMMQLEKLGVKA